MVKISSKIPDQHQNLIVCRWSNTHRSKNGVKTCRQLSANRQTDQHRQKHNLLGGGVIITTFLVPTVQHYSTPCITNSLLRRWTTDSLVLWSKRIFWICLVQEKKKNTQRAQTSAKAAVSYNVTWYWSSLKSVRRPPQSAVLHCQTPTLLLNRWLACLTGSSILVLKLTFSPDPFPRNLPLSLSNGLISRFLSRTCT